MREYFRNAKSDESVRSLARRDDRPLILLITAFFMILFFLLFLSPALAIDMNTRTITQSVGQGVNNGTDRVRGMGEENVTIGFSFSGGLLSFDNTADPFKSGGGFRVTADLSANFLAPNTQLGEGVPCGPNGAVMTPCSSNNSITQTIPGSITATGQGPETGCPWFCQTPPSLTIFIAPPSLGPTNAPFQKFISTDNGDGTRTVRIEFGFDQEFESAFNGLIDNRFDIYFTVDAMTDSNGVLVGNATGTWVLNAWDGSNTQGTVCTTLPTDDAGFGTFSANSSGMVACTDNSGNTCFGDGHPGFNVNTFSGPGLNDSSGCLPIP